MAISTGCGGVLPKPQGRCPLRSASDYSNAKDSLNAFRAALKECVSELRSVRVLPVDVSDSLERHVTATIDEAERRIDSCRSGHPRFLEKDLVRKSCLNCLRGGSAPVSPRKRRRNSLKRERGGKGQNSARLHGRKEGRNSLARRFLDVAADSCPRKIVRSANHLRNV